MTRLGDRDEQAHRSREWCGAHSSIFTSTDLQTPDAMFSKPMPHNLGWVGIVSLLETITAVERRANDEYAFSIASEHPVICEPHAKNCLVERLQAHHRRAYGRVVTEVIADFQPHGSAVVPPGTARLAWGGCVRERLP